MRKDWMRQPGALSALGVFVLALGVYVRTMAPTLSFWDCGEYITCSHILGIPHQPGTPLYVLMGRVFDVLLFFFSTARAVNFMSAFFSALGVMLTCLVIADLARRADPDSGWLAQAGGIIGALFLLFSDTYWNNAVEAEVYGPAAFMVALLTWLGLRWYDARREAHGDGILYLILYLLGLGVGFHLGSLLVYPAIFILVVLARDRRLSFVDLMIASGALALFLLSTMIKSNGLLLVLLIGYTALVVARALAGRRFALIGAGLFVLGLSVHLYLLIRAGLHPAINQSQPDNFATFMSVLRREQYPPLDPFKRQAPLWSWQFPYYYDFLLRQFSFLGDGRGALARIGVFVGPIFLGLLGIFHGLRRARPWIWMLLVGYFINADGLTLYLNFSNHEVRERDYFYSAGFMFAAMLIGLGAAALLRYAAGPEGKTTRELPPGRQVPAVRAGLLAKAAAGLLIVIAALPLLVPGHPKWIEHDRSRNWVPREYAWNMLAGLDRNAILFTNGDNDTFPIWYLQDVEKYRPDVTVLNLSLVNLPWYVKQMRQRDPQLPLSYTDPQIDQLEARIYEDPKTGEQQIVYVRDYIVHDVLTANRQRPAPRPVFFAVTIPQDNMALYFPYLKMEGLAFRLTPDKQAAGMPGCDAVSTLDNLLGVYDFRALMTGDSAARQRRYAAMAGAPTGARETGAPARLGAAAPPRLDYAPLLALLGDKRRDVWLDQNTTNLLGNYPAAAVQAGYDYLRQAGVASAADTVRYDYLIDCSLAAFDMARRFDPYFSMVGDFYPLLLVEKGRSSEALAYLDGYLAAARPNGRVRPEQAEESLNKTLMAMAGSGQVAAATAFLERRIATAPRDAIAYRVLFNVQRVQGDVPAARRILERWRAASGQGDPEMERVLQRLDAGGSPAAPADSQKGAR
ncbi:MAG: glycosyltransferase family 117 protein [Candidatus Krumholzibacteriia bacterium]